MPRNDVAQMSGSMQTGYNTLACKLIHVWTYRELRIDFYLKFTIYSSLFDGRPRAGGRARVREACEGGASEWGKAYMTHGDGGMCIGMSHH